MTRMLARDQARKGADGLTPLVPTSRPPEAVDSTSGQPFVPSAEEQAAHRVEQPDIGYAEEQAAFDAKDRAAVEKLGYGNTR
jgi:hypothetical protein